MITHHPSEEHLLHYAAGALTEGAALVVAGHLNFCPKCRHVVREAESVGGAMLEAAEVVPFEGPLAVHLDAGMPAPAPQPIQHNADVPAPLRNVIGPTLSGARWRWLWFGMELMSLGRPRGGGRTLLFRIQPGTGLPVHTHRGDEMTLVLQGSFTDETGHYEVGDVAMADPAISHRQIADPGAVCICLTAYDSPLRFSTVLAKLGAIFLLR